MQQRAQKQRSIDRYRYRYTYRYLLDDKSSPKGKWGNGSVSISGVGKIKYPLNGIRHLPQTMHKKSIPDKLRPKSER